MVLSGTPPYLVHHACLLEAGYWNEFSKLGTSCIYLDTLLCILNMPRESHHESVFRQGVESPEDALDRFLNVILTSLPRKSSVKSAIEPIQSDEGWDVDGWDEIDEDAHDLISNHASSEDENLSALLMSIQKDAKDKLISISERGRELSAEIRLSVLNMLRKVGTLYIFLFLLISFCVAF
jgi:hypothetical protein